MKIILELSVFVMILNSTNAFIVYLVVIVGKEIDFDQMVLFIRTMSFR